MYREFLFSFSPNSAVERSSEATPESALLRAEPGQVRTHHEEQLGKLRRLCPVLGKPPPVSIASSDCGAVPSPCVAGAVGASRRNIGAHAGGCHVHLTRRASLLRSRRPRRSCRSTRPLPYTGAAILLGLPAGCCFCSGAAAAAASAGATRRSEERRVGKECLL